MGYNETGVPFRFKTNSDLGREFIDIIPGDSTTKEIAYELIRQAARIASFKTSGAGEPLLSDEDIERRFFDTNLSGVVFEDGRIKAKRESAAEVLNVVRDDSLRLSIQARGGELTFNQREFDANIYPTSAISVMRGALMAFERRRKAHK